MKALSFLFLQFTLISGITEAQTLTADELIAKTNCTKFECFNEFVINKGFSFQEHTDLKSENLYSFFSDDMMEDATGKVKTRAAATILISKDKKITNISFRTIDKTCFLNLQSAFQNKRFIATTTSNETNGVTINYRSPRYPDIHLMVSTQKLKKGNLTWTSYDFEVERIR